MEILITSHIFIVGEQLDLILESTLSDFLQRIYFMLLTYASLLIYLLCSSVLQWIFLIVLVLQNLFESENHQEAGWYMSFVSKQFLKETQFSQSVLKSSNRTHPKIILFTRQWVPECFRLNAIISPHFLSYYLKVMEPYRWKSLKNIESMISWLEFRGMWYSVRL